MNKLKVSVKFLPILIVLAFFSLTVFGNGVGQSYNVSQTISTDYSIPKTDAIFNLPQISAKSFAGTKSITVDLNQQKLVTASESVNDLAKANYNAPDFVGSNFLERKPVAEAFTGSGTNDLNKTIATSEFFPADADTCSGATDDLYNNIYNAFLEYSGDVDWFKGYKTGTNTLRFILIPPYNKDYDLEIYDYCGGPRIKLCNTGTGIIENCTATVTGDFYVKVYGYSTFYSSIALYRLTAKDSGTCNGSMSSGTPSKSSFLCNETVQVDNTMVYNNDSSTMNYYFYHDLYTSGNNFYNVAGPSGSSLSPNYQQSWKTTFSPPTNGWLESGLYTARAYTIYWCGSNIQANNVFTNPNVPSAPCCSNDCSSSGLKRCNGSSSETCGNYDADSCLEWGNSVYCSSGCNSSTGQCINCNSHDYTACYDNDVYWYNSCSVLEDKKEECGTSYTNPAWYYYCSGNERRRLQYYNNLFCSSSQGASCTYSVTPVNDQLVETCTYSCIPGTTSCNNGCSGFLYAHVEDKWDNKISNAEVFVNGISQGKTDSAGLLKIPTLTEQCNQTFTINVKSPTGSDCGTKTTIIDKQADNDHLYFNCNTPIQAINLNVSTLKSSFDLGENIDFSIATKDSSNNNLNDVSIGIINPIDGSSSNILTSNGIASYSTKASIAGNYAFNFKAAKNGYNRVTKNVNIVVSDSQIVLDSDGDGLPDLIEILIGTNPKDSSSNLLQKLGGSVDYTNSCTGFLPLGVFSIEQKQAVLNVVGSNEMVSVNSLQNSSILSQQIQAQQLTFAEAVKNASEIKVFSKKDGSVVVLTNDVTGVFYIFVLTPICEGFYKGISYGAMQGGSDDYALGSGIVYYFLHWGEFGEKLNEISPSLAVIFSNGLGYQYFCNGIQSFFFQQYCTGIKNQLTAIVQGLTVAMLSDIAEKASQANTQYTGLDLVSQINKAGFTASFSVGYIGGYAVEQLATGYVVGGIAKASIRTIGSMIMKGIELSLTSIKALKETTIGLKLLNTGDEAVIGGSSKIMELLGDSKGSFNDIFSVVPDAEKFAKQFGNIGKKLETAFGKAKASELVQAIQESKAAKTMLEKEVETGLNSVADLKLKGISGSDNLLGKIESAAKNIGSDGSDLRGSLTEAKHDVAIISKGYNPEAISDETGRLIGTNYVPDSIGTTSAGEKFVHEAKSINSKTLPLTNIDLWLQKNVVDEMDKLDEAIQLSNKLSNTKQLVFTFENSALDYVTKDGISFRTKLSLVISEAINKYPFSVNIIGVE